MRFEVQTGSQDHTGTGSQTDFVVNFSVPEPDLNYVPQVTIECANGSFGQSGFVIRNRGTTILRLEFDTPPAAGIGFTVHWALVRIETVPTP